MSWSESGRLQAVMKRSRARYVSICPTDRLFRAASARGRGGGVGGGHVLAGTADDDEFGNVMGGRNGMQLSTQVIGTRTTAVAK